MSDVILGDDGGVHLVGTSEVTTKGGNCGYAFMDRTRGDRWVLYAQDNQARLWKDGSGNVVTVSVTGQITCKDITSEGLVVRYNPGSFVNTVSITATSINYSRTHMNGNTVVTEESINVLDELRSLRREVNALKLQVGGVHMPGGQVIPEPHPQR